MNEIERHIPLARSIAKKMYRKNSVYGLEDLEQVGFLSITKSISKYDKDKSMISTFLTRCIVNDIIKFINSQKMGRDQSYAAKKIEIDHVMVHLDCIENFDSLEEQVFNMRLANHTVKEIAENTGLSLKKTRKIIKQLKDNYES